jgi:hypothetical protein
MSIKKPIKKPNSNLLDINDLVNEKIRSYLFPKVLTTFSYTKSEHESEHESESIVPDRGPLEPEIDSRGRPERITRKTYDPISLKYASYGMFFFYDSIHNLDYSMIPNNDTDSLIEICVKQFVNSVIIKDDKEMVIIQLLGYRIFYDSQLINIIKILKDLFELFPELEKYSIFFRVNEYHKILETDLKLYGYKIPKIPKISKNNDLCVSRGNIIRINPKDLSVTLMRIYKIKGSAPKSEEGMTRE